MLLRCGRDEIRLTLPDEATAYAAGFPAPAPSPADAVVAAARSAIGGPGLPEALAARRAGEVVVVVSDVTRPVPYGTFQPALRATRSRY